MAWLWKQRRPTWLALAGLGWLGYQALQRWRQEDIRGQVVLITGSSRGLGLALAREFAAAGCRLVLCARDADALERARRDLAQRGAEVLSVPCDVTDREQVRRLVGQATERFGQIDILVNNAGIIQVGPMQTATEDFAAALDVMFWGVLYPTLAVLPQMRTRHRGRIVNITSIGGMVSVPHLLPYSCAKFAAVGLSEGLRAELGQEGIHVTTIVPGLMRTGSHLRAAFEGQQEREFTWFALGATLPLISISAERAARQIVRATQRGEAERILSLPANLLGRLHGVCPGTTANLLSAVNRVLPGPEPASASRALGIEVQQRLVRANARMRSRLLDVLTGLGRAAAHRLHQYAPAAADAGVSTPERQLAPPQERHSL
jgi:NAD(P)-dependent dehydrogenase (short-subunit alcohol dehydrogenase family)